MSEPRRRVLIESEGNPARPSAAQPQEGGVSRCDCPVLEAAEWDAVESDWSDITFLEAKVAAVAGVPVGFDGVRDRLMQRAGQLGLEIPDHPMLLVGDGQFRRRVLLEVEGAVRGNGVIRPGGFAYTRLVEAPWGELRRAARQLQVEASERYGRRPAATFAWYLTCRICSRERNFETLLVAHYSA